MTVKSAAAQAVLDDIKARCQFVTAQKLAGHTPSAEFLASMTQAVMITIKNNGHIDVADAAPITVALAEGP